MSGSRMKMDLGSPTTGTDVNAERRRMLKLSFQQQQQQQLQQHQQTDATKEPLKQGAPVPDKTK